MLVRFFILRPRPGAQYQSRQHRQTSVYHSYRDEGPLAAWDSRTCTLCITTDSPSPRLGHGGQRLDEPISALTLDDGPDDYHTLRILDVLSRKGATATFFVLAKLAARSPEIVWALRDAGHEIGLHGDDHSPLIGCSTREKFIEDSER